MVNFEQSARIHSDTSVVLKNTVDSFSGDNQDYVGHNNHRHLKGDRDVSQFASPSVSLCSNHTDEGLNDGKGGYMM